MPTPPLRILTAVPVCDGHDSPIMTINLELARHGVEVIYLGYHRSARDIVRAAIQEGVRAIGISSYNGGHVEFFTEVLALIQRSVVWQPSRLPKGRLAPIGLFGGGGGTITPADATLMKRRGVDEIFFAGTPLDDMIQWVRRKYAKPSTTDMLSRIPPLPLGSPLPSVGRAVRGKGRGSGEGGGEGSLRSHSLSDFELSQLLTAIESNHRASASAARHSSLVTRHSSPVIGFTGPGGAGKTTLIDELALRFLKARPRGRLAILSHDPSLPRQGALLADRATMIYAQNDHVFMRSLATRGHPGGLSPATARCLRLLRQADFDLVLVETAGIGQEDVPFGPSVRANAKGPRRHRLVDKQILVMSPDYGGRLQLQKLLMLEEADIVAVNKSDLSAARTAISEVGQRLALNRKGQKLIATVAKKHRDEGVTMLFKEIMP